MDKIGGTDELVLIKLSRTELFSRLFDYKEIKDVIDENFEIGVIQDNEITIDNIRACMNEDLSFMDKIIEGNSEMEHEHSHIKFIDRALYNYV